MKVYIPTLEELIELQKFGVNIYGYLVTKVTETITNVEIVLSKEDTKIGSLISTPFDYWYEIELNPETEPQTVIGYDDDGEKIFRLYPEGDDK